MERKNAFSLVFVRCFFRMNLLLFVLMHPCRFRRTGSGPKNNPATGKITTGTGWGSIYHPEGLCL